MEGGVSAGLMKEICNQIQVDQKKIREFGFVIFAVAGLLVPLFIYYRNDWHVTDWMMSLFAGSLIFLALCLIVPKYLYGLYRLWMLIAIAMGFVVTRFIVSIVFLLMMTPVGMVRRQNKKSVYRTFLDFNKNETESYWIRKDSDVYNPSDTERQF
jgi:hypothetical protein